MKTRLFIPLLAALMLAAPAAPASAAQELDHIVAIVNSDVITRTELDKRLQRVADQLAQRQVSAPPRRIFEQQVLERLVLERLELQLAERSGIRVDDQAINQVIANIARENRLTLPQFREVLERDGFPFAEFRENIRNEITVSRLRQRQVENRINVTDLELSHQLEAMRKQADEREYRLGHILIAVPEAASPQQIRAAQSRAEEVLGELKAGADFARTAVSRSDGQQALEGGDLGWRSAAQLPSVFADMVRDMQPGALGPLVRSASGFHIVKLLDTRAAAAHMVSQTSARHILVQTNRIVTDAEARQRLTNLARRIRAGEDFAALARAVSDDKGSAAQGGELGWVSPGQLVPEFEQAMHSLAPGEVSEPFRTQFGWHIVQVLDRRQKDETDELMRDRAREAVRTRKLDEALENWVRQLRDEAYVEIRLGNA